MKKLLVPAVLALAVSALAAAPSLAGCCCFGLFPHHRCGGCCGCGANFCVRQYNAFSPVCCGTVFCDGCCPFGSGGGGYGPGPCAGGGCPGGLNYSGVLGCGPGGCGAGGCGGAYLGSLPDGELGAPIGPGAPPASALGAPPAMGNPLPSGPVSQAAGGTIQSASYRQASPVAAPVRMQPQMMAAPSYWGN